MTLIPLNFRSNLARKSDFDPFQGLRDDMDKLFDNFFNTVPALKNSEASFVDFKINIGETDENIEVRAELPGVQENDIDVTLNKDIITIKGEKKLEKEEKEKNYHLFEARFGSFSRSLKLPFVPNAEQVEADYSNGVLTVKLQKPKELRNEPQKIELKKK